MCGIFGIVNSLNSYTNGGRTGYSGAYLKDADDFVMEAGMTSAVRGIHSTGVFGIKAHGVSQWYKKAVNPIEFFSSEVGKSVVSDGVKGVGVIGHVRHATSGDAADDNHAHPFCAERGDESMIVGVHNGTLYGWNTPASASLGCEVDSEWIYKRIAAEGFSAIDEFYGAFALVWWDSNDPRAVYMCRNDDRPLHFVMTKDGRHMLYASEARMLAWIAQRNGISIDSEVYSVPSGKVFRIDATDHQLDFQQVHEFDVDASSWQSYYRTSPRTPPTRSYDPWKHYLDPGYDDGWEDYGRKSMTKAIEDRYAAWASGEVSSTSNDDEYAETVVELKDFSPIVMNHIKLDDNAFNADGVHKYEKDAAKELGIYGKVFNFTPIDCYEKKVEGMTYLPELPNDLDGYYIAELINAFSSYSQMPTEDLPARYNYGVVVGVQETDNDGPVIVLSPIFPTAYEELKDQLFMIS